MTKPSAENRIRSRCRATTKLGVPCRATAIENGLRVMHSGRIDAREIGKKGGRSRKTKRVPFEEQVEAELDEPGMGKRLLSSGAAGFRVAAEVLERRRAEKAMQPDPVVLEGRRPPTWEDMVVLFRGTEQMHMLAELPVGVCSAYVRVPHSGRARGRARWKAGVPPEGAADVDMESPHRGAVPRIPVPVDEQAPPVPLADEPLPIETDADVEVLPSPDAHRSLDAMSRSGGS